MKFLYFIFLTCLINVTIVTGSDDTYNKIIEQHLHSLQNRENIHEIKPCFICFSGTPGMGKTTVAKKLEKEMKAIRINLDQGRTLTKESGLYPISGSDQDKEDYIMRYLDTLLVQLRKISKNNLIIIDDTVDRLYKYLVPLVEKDSAEMFLIRLDVSKETAIRRIKLREKHPNVYLQYMDRWYREFLDFKQKPFDYVFLNESDDQGFSIEPLVKSILGRIQL